MSGKEKQFRELDHLLARKEELNILDGIGGPPPKKPKAYQNLKIMIDTENERLVTYINSELYYINLTKA